jgi:transposase InsO family protein
VIAADFFDALGRPVQNGIDPSPRSLETMEAVELATLEWVSWFNHHRLLEPIGYIPPAEAEANYCAFRGT